MNVITCAGIVVFGTFDDNITKIILVKTPRGHWGFPKGKKHKKEDNLSAAVRELYEETGITHEDIELAVDPNGDYITLIDGYIIHYIAKGDFKQFVPKFDQDELTEVKWHSLDEALGMTDFELKNSRKHLLKDADMAFKGCSMFIKYNKKTISVDDIRLSKRLSWILRHKAIEFGLKVGNDGYLLVDDVLKLRQMADCNLEQIKRVVELNDKQRFTLVERDSQFYIRANQGHSKQVGSVIDDTSLLKKLTVPYDICFHGTYNKCIPLIKKVGLKPMNRKHIHLTNSSYAKSGIRDNCNALVFIDMKKAMDDGIEFYESDNGVILTEGKDGCIDPKYISNVITK